MAHEISEVLSKAMALPNEARAALAGALLESLDETVNELEESWWATEIALRIADLNCVKGTVIPWPERSNPVPET